MHGLERRHHHPRVEAAFRVRYQSFDQLVLAWATELSRGGVFLPTARSVPRKALVGLLLDLPEGGGKIRVIGRVARSRAEREAAAGQPAGLQVDFLEEEWNRLGAVEEFIDRHTRARTSAAALPTGRIPVSLLVVDDNDEYRDLAARPFRERGDRVRTARDGLEALTLCLQEPPEVILSDLEMPRMDGWNLLRVVRSRPLLADMPFLFLTVLGGEQDRLRGYQLGVDDYIPKPYRPEEIVARVDRLVARARGPAPVSREAKTLRGDLQQVALPSVLAFLEVERKTGVLAVAGPGRLHLHFSEGRLLRVEGEAATAGSGDQELLFEALGWKRGQFELFPQEVVGEDRLAATITALLLEYTFRHDEQTKGQG